MKAVLISIQPKWVEKIASGEKTIEVRKNRPNIEPPFKCYIYQTKHKNSSIYQRFKVDDMRNGKVIGEFICDRIDEYESEFVPNDCRESVDLIDREDVEDQDYPNRRHIWDNEGDNYNFDLDTEIIKGSRVSYIELKQYVGLGFKTFYGWHITDLKIYDKPKELGEFRHICKNNLDCDDCKYFAYQQVKYGEVELLCPTDIPLKKAPQSWCYVEADYDSKV